MAKHDDADDAKPKKSKKRGVAAAVQRRRARAKAVSKPRENPAGGGMMDDVKVVGTGVAAYGATRLLQRMAFTIVGRRKPKWAKLAHVAAGALAFAGTLMVGRKIKALDRFYEGMVMGTGIAAAQGAISAYLPKYGWVVNDCRPEDIRLSGQQAPTLPAGRAADPYDQMIQQLDSGMTPAAVAPPATATAVLAQAAEAAGDVQGLEESLLAEMGDGESLEDLYQGAFQGGPFAN